MRAPTWLLPPPRLWLMMGILSNRSLSLWNLPKVRHRETVTETAAASTLPSCVFSPVALIFSLSLPHLKKISFQPYFGPPKKPLSSPFNVILEQKLSTAYHKLRIGISKHLLNASCCSLYNCFVVFIWQMKELTSEISSAMLVGIHDLLFLTRPLYLSQPCSPGRVTGLVLTTDRSGSNISPQRKEARSHKPPLPPACPLSRGLDCP